MRDPKANTLGVEPVAVVAPRDRLVVERLKADHADVGRSAGYFRGDATSVRSYRRPCTSQDTQQTCLREECYHSSLVENSIRGNSVLADTGLRKDVVKASHASYEIIGCAYASVEKP